MEKKKNYMNERINVIVSVFVINWISGRIRRRYSINQEYFSRFPLHLSESIRLFLFAPEKKSNLKSFFASIFFFVRKSDENYCVETWPKENLRSKAQSETSNIQYVSCYECFVVRVINTNKHFISNIFHIRNSHEPITQNSRCHGCGMEKEERKIAIYPNYE